MNSLKTTGFLRVNCLHLAKTYGFWYILRTRVRVDDAVPGGARVQTCENTPVFSWSRQFPREKPCVSSVGNTDRPTQEKAHEMQDFGFGDFRISRISRFRDFGISRFGDFKISGFRDFKISGFQDFGILRFQDFEISGFRDFGNLGFREFGISGFRDFWISGFWDFGILRF